MHISAHTFKEGSSESHAQQFLIHFIDFFGEYHQLYSALLHDDQLVHHYTVDQSVENTKDNSIGICDRDLYQKYYYIQRIEHRSDFPSEFTVENDRRDICSACRTSYPQHKSQSHSVEDTGADRSQKRIIDKMRQGIHTAEYPQKCRIDKCNDRYGCSEFVAKHNPSYDKQRRVADHYNYRHIDPGIVIHHPAYAAHPADDHIERQRKTAKRKCADYVAGNHLNYFRKQFFIRKNLAHFSSLTTKKQSPSGDCSILIPYCS